MWFKNLKLFRLAPDWSPTTEELETALEKVAFQPGNSQSMQSLGWVPPREDSGLVYASNGQYLLALRSETKVLPATVVNQATKAKALEIEEQQGFKPGRKQMKDIKEQVTDELLPKAFSMYRDTRVWLDPRNHWLVIDTPAAAKSDEVLGMLSKAIGTLPVMPLYVEQSPATAMTNWLLADEPPPGFTIDQDTDLQSTSASGAKVRYVRQSIEVEDIRKHVQAGKQCTRLALTWNDRVSFVLDDGLNIKRVVALDVLKEGRDSTAQNEAEQFESDFTLMAGELVQLLAALVEALGGEKEHSNG